MTPPHSPAEITLVCWTCDDKFTMRRRHGQYPRKCLVCRDLAQDPGRARDAAGRILGRLQRAGLGGAIVDHHRLGVVVLVDTPWHNQGVPVRTNDDADYLLAELANQPKVPGEQAA